MSGINRNRGCTIRMHPAGMRVVMYQDAPGEYYGERGEPLPIEMAKAAGYDVAFIARERAKQDKLASFKQKLDADYASQEEALANAMSAGGELRAKHIGGGQYAIFDGEQRLTRFALNAKEAEILLGELSGEEPGDTEGPDSDDLDPEDTENLVLAEKDATLGSLLGGDKGERCAKPPPK